MKKMKRITSLLLVFTMLCTLLPTALAEGEKYTVSLSAADSVAQGSTLEVGVDVTSSSETTYNAFYATLTYDSTKFDYSNISNADYSVDSSAIGTLKISKTGSDVSISTNPDFTLTFTAKETAAGTGEFALTSAKVDSAGNAENDAPNAALSNAELNVTVTERIADLIITTEQELHAFAASINSENSYQDKLVKLAADITLNGAWTPIAGFRGTFDGGGHTISNMTITVTERLNNDSRYGYSTDDCVGLFAMGTIKNLTVMGNITVTEDYPYNDGATSFLYVGGIVGWGSAENCVSIVNITCTTPGNIGGVAGGTNGTITGCTNYGALSLDLTRAEDSQQSRGGNVGGIVGESYGDITQCANYGSISVTGGQFEIVDQAGNVLAVAESAVGKLGGIVGCYIIGAIQDSANKGSISGNVHLAGGIVGQCSRDLTLTNCYNTGEIHNTGDYTGFSCRARIGGLVGSAYYCQYNVTLANCYNAGTVTTDYGGSVQKGCMADPLYGSMTDIGVNSRYTGTCTKTNCYTSGMTAAKLGSAYKDDVNNVNGGYPLLVWEAGEVSDETYAVTLLVMPTNATVTVYSDAAMTQVVPKGVNGYELKGGTYYYKVEASGYVTQTGSFSVSVFPISLTVTLRKAAQVTFYVTPITAEFALYDNTGRIVEPNSSGNGMYAYTLYSGVTYRYDANAEGYNSTTREFVAVNNTVLEVKLTKSGEIQGEIYGDGNPGKDYIITEGGVYRIGKDATGILTISTSDPVTLVGTGTGMDSMYEDLYIDCKGQTTNLTLRDVYISNITGKADPKMTNMIDFRGSGNVLTFEGVSILDENTNATGYAMVHVPDGTQLTVTGGTAYFYKREQGAGIGGNGGASGGEGQVAETNGTITISNATLFMKNSKQGALIGAGASAGTQTPGPITIQNSTLNLVTISRGGAIGGSAGSTGASSGSRVTVTNSTVNINVDWSGSAIGGGGFDGGNDSDGGTLYVSGSSIRTYIDTNAVGQWSSFGVTAPGVNGNKAITADIYTQSGKKAYLLMFNTALLSATARSFVVTENNQTVYSGGLHQYRYINEDVDKYGQTNIEYTIDNWVSLSDSNLYLYLSGEDHELTVNGEKFKVTWNAASQSFKVEKVKGNLCTTTVENGVATVTVNSDALKEILKTADSYTEITLAAEIPEGEHVTRVTTEVTEEDLVAIASSGASLKVETPIASASLTNSGLRNLAAKNGQVVTVTTRTVTDYRGVATGEIAIEVAVDGKTVSYVPGGVAISVPSGSSYKGNVLVLVNSDGSESIIKTAIVDVYGYHKTVLDGTATVKIVDNGKSFPDVPSGYWAKDSIDFVSAREIFLGTDKGFEPSGLMTRAMLVTVLYRLEDSPAVSGTSSFTDVKANQWYTNAVIWATKNGIVEGYGNGRFGTGDSVTREQMATIMFRYAQFKGYDVSATTRLSGYSDAAEISNWASTGMTWANATGLITGRTTTTLVPQGTAMRAEVAEILMRFCENVIN